MRESRARGWAWGVRPHCNGGSCAGPPFASPAGKCTRGLDRGPHISTGPMSVAAVQADESLWSALTFSMSRTLIVEEARHLVICGSALPSLFPWEHMTTDRNSQFPANLIGRREAAVGL